jgi:hypothetical protein
MENNPENTLDPEDELKFQNEFLKLKLKLEHNMEQSDTSSLSPEIENLWLSNIYNFEQQYKNAKRVKVYDALGCPAFKKVEELSEANIQESLHNLLSLMENKGVVLDCCCTYDDTTIYRFITEELFDHEMDEIFMDGMVCHFIYEEFHPNHDYDLRAYTIEFFENLLTRAWNPEFNSFMLDETVTYNGKSYNHAEISSIILAFQQDRSFKLEKIEIKTVDFDVDKGNAKVCSYVDYQALTGVENQFYQGDSTVWFVFDLGHWLLSGFQLPGFGNGKPSENCS